MRRFILVALCALIFAAPAHVQTTGVPGINDYTIGGLTSGSTSCTPLSFLGGGAITFSVSASTAGLPYFIFASAGPPGTACCRPCVFPILPSPCPIPPSTLCPGTNQVIDILLGAPCTWLTPIFGVTGVGGVGSMTITVPPGVSFGTQVGIVDPLCNSGTAPITLTQAYLVRT